MTIVNKEEFDQLAASGTTVVDFFADWCGPCKMLGPVLEEVSSKYPDISFVKVNCDNEEELARKFRVMSIPAVFMIKDGKPVASFVGYQDADAVTKFIETNK